LYLLALPVLVSALALPMDYYHQPKTRDQTSHCYSEELLQACSLVSVRVQVSEQAVMTG
jgi:hypothetical protein